MKKAILGALFAGAMLASCSSDEPVINGPDVFDGDQAFVKVRIAMADNSGHGTRSVTDGSYVNGSPTEQKVYSLGFKFYKADGTFYGYGEAISNPTTKPNGTEGSTGNNIEAFVDATVVLKVAEGGTKPSYVVTYVNCDNYKAASEAQEPNMNDISARTAATANETQGESSVLKFRMTTSNFKNSGANAKDGYLTPVSPDKFYESVAAATAENNYVDIYVERLAAKVSVTQATGLTPETVTRGEYTLDFTVKGFQLGGINTESYLIKNFDTSWNESTPWSSWQIVNDFRSFWAKDINYNYTATSLDYAKYNEGYDNNNALYCNENTFEARTAQSTVNRYKVQPFVYVMGVYTVKKNGTAVTSDVYNYAGGIYPKDQMTNILQNACGTIVYKQDGADNKKFIGQDLNGKVDITSYTYEENNTTITDASRVMLQLKEDADLADLFVRNPDQSATEKYIAATPELVNNALKKSNVTAVGFKYDQSKGGHLAYFPVLIEHLNWQSTLGEGAVQPVGAFGVVRNHVYNITINSIASLGIGVFDPTVDIIPDDTVKEYYLGAKINILSWKVVNQGVDL